MFSVRKLFLLVILLVTMPVMAQNVRVHGSASGGKDGTPVLLMLSDGRLASSIAYDSIRDGVFSLKATVEDGLYYLP